MELALTQIDELKEWFEQQWQEIQCCKANVREIALIGFRWPATDCKKDTIHLAPWADK